MKKNSLLFVLLIIGFTSCKKKEEKSKETSYSPECSGATPTYASNVSPIIASSCAMSGCHAAGNTNGPGALTTYAQIKSAAASIRSSIVSGSMPKNATLSNAQRNSIVCWIDAGAVDN